MVRKSEAMAQESLGWRERGQANRTRNIKLCFSVREEEKAANSRGVRRRDGAGSKRQGDSEGPLGQQVSARYIPPCVSRHVQTETSRGIQHAIDSEKEKSEYISKARATA